MNEYVTYALLAVIVVFMAVISYLFFRIYKDAKRTVPNGIIAIVLGGLSSLSGASLAASSRPNLDLIIGGVTLLGAVCFIVGVKLFGHSDDDFAAFCKRPGNRKRFFGLLRYVDANYVEGEDAQVIADEFGVHQDVVVDVATFLAIEEAEEDVPDEEPEL
jgi:hypothetical protein